MTDDELAVRGLVPGAGVPGGPVGWPSRLPAMAEDRVPEPFMRLMAQLPAGVRLATITRSRRVSVSYRAARIALAHDPSPVPAALTVSIDGHDHATRAVDGPVARVTGDGYVVYPDDVPRQRWGLDLPAGEKLVELWLPHSALIDEIRLDSDLPLSAAPTVEPIWIHYGSSISHCLEAETPTGTWPAVAGRLLGFDSTSLGLAGSAMLDPFMARVIRDSPADLISIKVGINLVNSDAIRRRMLRPLLDGFLDTIRDGHPDTPIVVCSPIACPGVETNPGPTALDPATGELVAFGTADDLRRGSLTLRAIRAITAEEVTRRSVSDPALYYLDGLRLLDVDEAHLLPDGLHPGPEGYRRIGERFASALREWGIGAA